MSTSYVHNKNNNRINYILMYTALHLNNVPLAMTSQKAAVCPPPKLCTIKVPKKTDFQMTPPELCCL